MQYSVCIDAVFAGRPMDEAVAAVAAAGYPAFEFWGWWTRDPADVAALARQHGLTVAACCTRFVSLVDPARREEYLGGLAETLAAARVFGCRTIISQVGDALPGVTREEQRASLVAGLRAAVPLLAQTETTLVFEPLNTRTNHAGYFLAGADEAFAIAREVNDPHIKVLYDIYHQQVSEGDLLTRIEPNIDLIGHFHAAGCPGRHELDTGEIHYPRLLGAVADTGYQGYVGLEYYPLDAPEAGIGRFMEELIN